MPRFKLTWRTVTEYEAEFDVPALADAWGRRNDPNKYAVAKAGKTTEGGFEVEGVQDASRLMDMADAIQKLTDELDEQYGGADWPPDALERLVAERGAENNAAVQLMVALHDQTKKGEA